VEQLVLKRKLLDSLIAEIDERIASEQFSIDAAQDAARSESKTSSGDMYESDVALMQLEQEKYVEQLDATVELRKKLNTINVSQIYNTVQTGSVINTTLGKFFIAISGEDIEIEDDEYTPISLRSPFGMMIKDAKAGTTIEFREKLISISEVF